MRFTYIFENNIDTENVNELISKLSEHEKIDLFFSTEGGYIFPMKSLLHYLNSRKDDIHIYLTDRILSAGMLLLTEYKGEKTITKELEFMMAHCIDAEEYTVRKSAVSKKQFAKQRDKDNQNLAEGLKRIGFTPKEIKKFHKGEDVILYQKDFKRINLK